MDKVVGDLRNLLVYVLPGGILVVAVLLILGPLAMSADPTLEKVAGLPLAVAFLLVSYMAGWAVGGISFRWIERIFQRRHPNWQAYKYKVVKDHMEVFGDGRLKQWCQAEFGLFMHDGPPSQEDVTRLDRAMSYCKEALNCVNKDGWERARSEDNTINFLMRSAISVIALTVAFILGTLDSQWDIPVIQPVQQSWASTLAILAFAGLWLYRSWRTMWYRPDEWKLCLWLFYSATQVAK